MELDNLQNATYAARQAFYETLGQVDDDVITFAINPGFMGGPMWPGVRQAYKIIRRANGNIAIASDGLSDPFEDDYEPSKANNGLGIEFLVETSDDIGQDFQAISSAWLFTVVSDMCSQAANHGGFREIFAQYPIMSMELWDDGSFTTIATVEKRYGVLLGVEGENGTMGFDGPAEHVRVITIKLLNPEQLQQVVEGGQAARDALNEQYKTQGVYHVNSLLDGPLDGVVGDE